MAINAVSPPILVKAYFLDVTNSRGPTRSISFNAANAYGGTAPCRGDRRGPAGSSTRRPAIACKRSNRPADIADSFTRMIEQFREEERSGVQSYVEARRIAVDRDHLDTMRDILRAVSAKVLLI